MTGERPRGEHPDAADEQLAPGGDLEQTVLVPRTSQPSVPAVRLGREPDVHPDLEQTVVRLIEPATPPARPRRLPTIMPDVDVPLASSVPAPPSVPAQQRASKAPPSSGSSTPSAQWSVRVRGTSAVVPLDLPAVVGRRPGAQRVPEHPPPRRIVIPADRGDVSSRHARIEQLGDTLVVSDLGSTNGIVVHWSSGSRSRLRPGESCALLPDAVVVLGEGVELEFLVAGECEAAREPLSSG